MPRSFYDIRRKAPGFIWVSCRRSRRMVVGVGKASLLLYRVLGRFEMGEEPFGLRHVGAGVQQRR